MLGMPKSNYRGRLINKWYLINKCTKVVIEWKFSTYSKGDLHHSVKGEVFLIKM